MPRARNSYYDGPRLEWERTRNPVWVWQTIVHCAHYREPLPRWVLDYLVRCAKRIENMKGDFGRGLHGALEFPAKSGRKRTNAINMTTERFAMKFAKAVLSGATIEQARKDASASVDGPNGKDEKELNRRLREFFQLKSLPGPGKDQKAHWRRIIAVRLMHLPGYAERYPDMPTTFDLR